MEITLRDTGRFFPALGNTPAIFIVVGREDGIDQIGSHAAYIRRSTAEQENEHQLSAINNWLEDHDVDDVEFLSETPNGASRSREKFLELIDLIRDNGIDHVVVWELSRLAREGQLAQEFLTPARITG